MELSVKRRSWIILAMQIFLVLSAVIQLGVYAVAPDPSAFQRFGTIMIFSGVLFMALHGPNLIEWQIARRDGNHEAGQVKAYEFAATFVVNVVLIGVGTLITGYGDQFVCLLNGKGFQSCSF